MLPDPILDWTRCPEHIKRLRSSIHFPTVYRRVQNLSRSYPTIMSRVHPSNVQPQRIRLRSIGVVYGWVSGIAVSTDVAFSGLVQSGTIEDLRNIMRNSRSLPPLSSEQTVITMHLHNDKSSHRVKLAFSRIYSLCHFFLVLWTDTVVSHKII